MVPSQPDAGGCGRPGGDCPGGRGGTLRRLRPVPVAGCPARLRTEQETAQRLALNIALDRGFTGQEADDPSRRLLWLAQALTLARPDDASDAGGDSGQPLGLGGAGPSTPADPHGRRADHGGRLPPRRAGHRHGQPRWPGPALAGRRRDVGRPADDPHWPDPRRPIQPGWPAGADSQPRRDRPALER